MIGKLLFVYLAFAAAPSLPPAVIYHVGSAAVVGANEAADTVPLEAWDKFVMGEDTRYGLTPWRRGLYGGESFDDLELYGNLYAGTDKVPAVMGIRIKEECRTKEAVSRIRADDFYGEWLERNIGRIVENSLACLYVPESAKNNCADIVIDAQDVAHGKKANDCDDLVAEYLRDRGARVVKDDIWKDSWYIRDRSCIEGIEGSPEEQLRILAAAKWDHASRQGAYSGTNGYGLSTFAILVAALTDSTGPTDPAVLDRIKEKGGASDIGLDFSGQPIEKRRAWVREAVPAAVDAYRRCGESRAAEFRSLGLKIRDELKVKMESVNQYAQIMALADRFHALCR